MNAQRRTRSVARWSSRFSLRWLSCPSTHTGQRQPADKLKLELQRKLKRELQRVEP